MRPLLINILLLLSISTSAFSAEPVERIAAVVNGQIIFLSDIQRDRTFFSEPPSPSVAGADLRPSLEALIDKRLLRSEAHRFVVQGPSDEEVRQKLKSIRRRFQTDAAFDEALRRTGLSLEELKGEIVENLWVEKLLQERISSFIFVSPKEVDEYYQDHPATFSGKKLEEVEPKIHAALAAQKEAAKKKEYLARLRSHAEIRINLQ